jgi:prepilin-type N-terminal cleavage/methylation domain-containing protein
VRERQAGFSLIEVLVSLAIFSAVSAGFYTTMSSAARSSDVTRNNVTISAEARLGFNRMVRDVREAGWIELSSNDATAVHTSFTVKVDFDGNGTYTNPAGATPDPLQSYEDVTYSYDAVGKRITLTAGAVTETLMENVEPVPGEQIFTFTSNRLEYDWNDSGVTTLAELTNAACPPNNITTLDTCNTTLSAAELGNVTSVGFAIRVIGDGNPTDFHTQAQLRNRR